MPSECRRRDERSAEVDAAGTHFEVRVELLVTGEGATACGTVTESGQTVLTGAWAAKAGSAAERRHTPAGAELS
jgi:hypothetical protein